jgi:pilus assembly protein CpaE
MLAIATQKDRERIDMNNAHKHFTLMAASRSSEALTTMQSLLSPVDDITISQKHICNGHSDPLYGVTEFPDLLVFWIGETWEIELSEMAERALTNRVPVIIIGDTDNPQAMRMAMKAGAIDYFRVPVNHGEFIEAINHCVKEHQQKFKQEDGCITAVINAKGGGGGSFIASNIAHIMQAKLRQNVALLGLDIQFGSLSSYFDITPEYGLLDALSSIDEIDRTALNGYMTKHQSGLKLMDVKPGALLMADDIDSNDLYKLLHLLKTNFDHTVIDLPRHIDAITGTAMEYADNILIVMQQNLAHLHDAQRLLRMIVQDLAIESDRVSIVINRYNKNEELTLEDVKKALKKTSALTIPNSFEQVTESINHGEPFWLNHKNSAVSRSILNMGEQLCGYSNQEKNGLSKIMQHFSWGG